MRFSSPRSTAVADTFAEYKTERMSQIKPRNMDSRAAENQKGRKYRLDVKQIQEDPEKQLTGGDNLTNP